MKKIRSVVVDGHRIPGHLIQDDSIIFDVQQGEFMVTLNATSVQVEHEDEDD